MITPTSKYDNGRETEPLDERILRQIVIDDEGCWLWQGYIDKLWGYGQMVVGSRRDGSRRSAKTHIVSYEEFVGPVPAGMTLDHTCNVRHCVNPDHLTPMTQRDNTLKQTSLAPTAINSRKTHCSKGHPLSGENLRFRPDGGRVCRICQGWIGRIPIFEQDQTCAWCGSIFRKRYRTECCSRSCANHLHPRGVGLRRSTAG